MAIFNQWGSPGNPYDMRSEDPTERSLARRWEEQQLNPVPVWSSDYVGGESYDLRSENPDERSAARDQIRQQNQAFAQNYGLNYTPGVIFGSGAGLGASEEGISKARQWEDLFNRWTSNTDPTLPTLNMSPEQKTQVLQQLYQNPDADVRQFLTPEQRQVTDTYLTFYDQQSGFDPMSKALMAGMIGGFGALAGPSLFGAGEAAGAGADAAWGVNPQTAGAAGGVGELGGPAPWWETVAATTPSNVASTALAGVPGALDVALPLSAAAAGGLAAPFSGGGGILDAIGNFGSKALTQIGDKITNDPLGTIGTVGQTLLGGYAANQQTGAYSDLANQFLGMGQPYRDRLNATYDPNWSFADTPDMKMASQSAMDQAARALSTKFGNPADSPSAIGELLKYGISNNLDKSFNYRNQLGQFGGLGAAPVAAGANSGLLGVKAQGGLYESLGSGFENLMNPYKLNTGSYL